MRLLQQQRDADACSPLHVVDVDVDDDGEGELDDDGEFDVDVDGFADASRLRILTLNVWFSPHKRDERCAALERTLLESAASLVCLQELTSDVHARLLANAEVARRYAFSDARIANEHGYDVAVLIDRRLVCSASTRSWLPFRVGSAQGRRALAVRLPAARVVVLCVHAESTAARVDARHDQLAHAFALVEQEAAASSSSESSSESSWTAVLAGDTNVTRAERALVVPAPYVDAWARCARRGRGHCRGVSHGEHARESHASARTRQAQARSRRPRLRRRPRRCQERAPRRHRAD